MTDDRGGPEDFASAFEPLAAIAYRVAFRVLGNREDARDVAQEALSRAFARWSRVSAYAEPWVARVAANEALGRARRGQGAQRVATAGASSGVLREQALGPGELVSRLDLVRVLAKLPKRQREVVVLRHLADLPEADVARVLGCSVGTVKSQGHRGLAALRLLLDPELLAGVTHV